MKSSKKIKLLALLLCGLMTLPLFACDNGEGGTTADETRTEAETTVVTTEETTTETTEETTAEVTTAEVTTAEVTTAEETTEEETTSEETTEEETTVEEVTGDYSNSTGIGAAGAKLDDDAFALTVNKIDELKAVTKTAAELLALLEKKDGVKAGEVYRVTETLTLSSDTTYYGNMAVIIAEGGVVIKDASGTTLKEIIMKGSVTVNNSSEITLYKVDIKGGATGISIDDKSGNISISNSIVSADDTAISSKGAIVSVYQSKLVAKTGVVSSGTDFTVQSTIVDAVLCGMKSSGRYFISRNNTITVSDTKNGIGIDMIKGSYNSMAALNVIKDVQKSIDVTDGFNCVVVLNRAITVTGSNNKYFYVIKNRLGGELEFKNNDYFIADGNTFIDDGRTHPTALENNTNFNGDNLHDVNARLEFGADEDLLPHTNADKYLGMERREKITDLSSASTYSYTAYVTDSAAWNKIVIVPPGAYTTSSTTTIIDKHSNTDFYCYGAYAEATFSRGNIWKIDHASNLKISGLTVGHTRSNCGQVHVLEVDKENKTLKVVVSAGFVDGFHYLNSTLEGDVNYNPAFLSSYHFDESGGLLEYKDGVINASDTYGGRGSIVKDGVIDNGDGTYTMKMNTITDNMIPGDIYVTRLGERGQNTIYHYYADGVQYTDLTVFGITNATTNRVISSRGVTYLRYHSARSNAFRIDKETFDKYEAWEKEYEVDLGVYYDEEYRMYRGMYPVWGASSSMEVGDGYDGTKLTSSILESTCDDGSNQRGSSSRIAGMVKNSDNTYTVYYKGNLASAQFPNSKTMASSGLSTCATLAVGDTIVAYTIDGRALIKDAIVLTEPKAGSPEDLHLAHTFKSGDICEFCGKKISDSTIYKEQNTTYNPATGALSFQTKRSSGSTISGLMTWTTTIYSVTIDAKYVNEDIIDEYDFCLNSYLPENRVILDNVSRNCSGIVFDNVLVENIQSRGLLAKTNDVTVKHSTFRNLTLQALVFGPEQEWSESTISRNVLVEHCIFDNCGKTNEYAKTNHEGYDSEPNMCPIDIRGVGSTSESTVSNISPHADFLASNFVIRHNKFINTPNKHMICVTAACDVTITENVFEEREGDGEIVYINACYNVEVMDNVYTERMQKFFEKGNYSPIADIYNCEYVKVETLKIPDKVTILP